MKGFVSFAMSAPVNTATTLGSRRAASTSTLRMSAWG